MNIKHIFLTACAGMALSMGTTSCSDVFDDLDNKVPEWLGENIYDYLVERGDCNYYVRLIDDCGLKDVMQTTGSNTLFFTSDAAFDKWFENNKLTGNGPRSYDEMSLTQKKMLIGLGRISNAQLIERLCQGDVSGTVLRRSTYWGTSDSVPQVYKTDLMAAFPGNKYFEALPSDTINLLQDASQVTLTQFFPDVLTNLGITDDDVQFITNGAASSSVASLYGNKIINQARRSLENMYQGYNQATSVNWRWRKEGDVTMVPRAVYQEGYNSLPSDRYVEDGSFLRMKYITLRYQFLKKTAQRLGLNSLSFYVTINNLFRLTKYSGVDPEVSIGSFGMVTDNSSTPRSKDWMAGVKLSF